MKGRRAISLAVAAAALQACTSAPKQEVLTDPTPIVAPYDTSRGEVLWAVVPLRNESGTTVADTDRLSDKLIAAAEQIEGVRVVPLNRTLDALRAHGVTSLASPAEARRLAQVMGVDAVVVGSITAYDPYTPVIGLAVAIYGRTGGPAPPGLDPRALAASPTEPAPGPGRFNDQPLAVASEHLDAKNHAVLAAVKAYARGRQSGPSALGWKRYTASMDLYSEFAAHQVMDSLMRQEWERRERVHGDVVGVRE